ncbi:MAG: hypothetical protein JXN59_06900 [Anaerolineae bacterium]|nr:hypothetical protein [Anaerolineae bacterium]
MTLKPAVRNLILLWLAWAILIIGFQAVIDWRMDPKIPDDVLMWTANETTRSSQRDKPYLVERFMNHQVSWDSEFYLSIATVGYDDPAVRMVAARQPSRDTRAFSMNYAFFPVYPAAIRALALPLHLFDLSAIARSTLAGVIVSLLGTLGAMLALYDLAREELGEDGGQRAAFYLLVFPSGFFLAQVYTEGLFVGLAFGSLALLRRRRWVWAALLAALATGTRAIGGLLIIPLALAWLAEYQEDNRFSRRVIGLGLLALAPLVAYGLWSLALGEPFHFVEEHHFGRGLLKIGEAIGAWMSGLERAAQLPETAVYYTLEIGATALAIIACFTLIGRYPGLALFGLGSLFITLTSGWAAQGMVRYALAVPALFIWLARLGRHPVFDRVWTTGSVLLLGMEAALFTFDMWVG